MSKLGPVIFFILIIVVAFGVVSFASEFFLGRPLMDVVRDFLFVLFRK
ncbi:MAG TPA: hypothetical protein VGW77_17290 [Candidatus Binatia bacterium]|nr:hypothetical protein [Candidatus Binatia bacterium]